MYFRKINKGSLDFSYMTNLGDVTDSEEDRELNKCANYSTAKSGAIITYFNNPEIDCRKCEDAYDNSCPGYKPKWEFLKGQYNFEDMLSD